MAAVFSRLSNQVSDAVGKSGTGQTILGQAPNKGTDACPDRAGGGCRVSFLLLSKDTAGDRSVAIGRDGNIFSGSTFD